MSSIPRLVLCNCIITHIKETNVVHAASRDNSRSIGICGKTGTCKALDESGAIQHSGKTEDVASVYSAHGNHVWSPDAPSVGSKEEEDNLSYFLWSGDLDVVVVRARRLAVDLSQCVPGLGQAVTDSAVPRL